MNALQRALVMIGPYLMIEQDYSGAKQQTGARNDIALECRRGDHRPHACLCCVSPPPLQCQQQEVSTLTGPIHAAPHNCKRTHGTVV